ncbi:hypothetical protein CMI47_03725 [Candidatus Pacearchaeota archaeon]|jgi:hypothetical protein|nr:hypothetical protein [Candidatus Pacearchaeota archaeon]|tara:strand:+ start:544 stop:1050 length:507 start_codon:yes stop_codon:yes gene_type:complete
MDSDTRRLDDELSKYNAVKEMLAGEDLDEQTLLDTLEGETTLHECLLAIDESILADEAQVRGLQSIIDDMLVRLERFKKSRGRKRAVIEAAMLTADLKTLKLPTATLTVKPTPRKPVIEDEAAIPAAYWKAQNPKLDRKALADALKAGEAIPGATLDNGGVTLSVRRK